MKMAPGLLGTFQTDKMERFIFLCKGVDGNQRGAAGAVYDMHRRQTNCIRSHYCRYQKSTTNKRRETLKID